MNNFKLPTNLRALPSGVSNTKYLAFDIPNTNIHAL